jgi:hypothetical protein
VRELIPVEDRLGRGMGGVMQLEEGVEEQQEMELDAESELREELEGSNGFNKVSKKRANSCKGGTEQASEAGRYITSALLVGASMVLLTAESLIDRVSMKATIKNKDIREPDMRLPAITPFAYTTSVGGVVVAIG